MSSEASKPLPFTQNEVLCLASRMKTPFYLYDDITIRETCRQLKNAFSWVKAKNGFTNYFAVKATPNPHILHIIKQEGFGADCSSMAELLLSEACGYTGEDIMFTSNNTPLCEFEKAISMGAIVNLDDISHVDFIHEKLSLPKCISLRYNPGEALNSNFIIGEPSVAKFGLTKEQIFEAIALCKERGVSRFGLHTMIVSNCLDLSQLADTARVMFELAIEVWQRLNVAVEFVNLGGGIGVPYHPTDEAVNLKALGQKMKTHYDNIIVENRHPDIRVVLECGRFITAPAGCLVTRVIHHKNTHRKYIGVDACMADLMRPGLYKAYHHITVIHDDTYSGCDVPSNRNLFGDDADAHSLKFDVVGALCENNDKFAIDRVLNAIPRIGDLIVISDTGGHGHSMGFNYNGRLRSAEYLKKSDGTMLQIRDAQSIASYFDTLKWPGLDKETLKRRMEFL